MGNGFGLSSSIEGSKNMRRALFTLWLGLALGAGCIGPAAAGGDLVAPDYRSGINPYGVATPVPAPIPVAVYEAAWYFRGDFAAGFGSDPSVTATGTPFANNTVGFNPAWLSKSFEPSFTGGVGVGYVWGPAFRTDLTVDLHSIMQAKYIGTNAAADLVRRRQDQALFHDPAAQRLLRLPHRHAVHALHRRWRRLRCRSGHAQQQPELQAPPRRIRT